MSINHFSVKWSLLLPIKMENDQIFVSPPLSLFIFFILRLQPSSYFQHKNGMSVLCRLVGENKKEK